MMPRLLIVEDDPAVRRSLAETLTAEGLDVVTANNAEEAVVELGREAPDAILSDVRMPGMDGLELLHVVRERAPDVDIVLMTAYDSMETVARAMREGAFDFLVKPLQLSELRDVVARLLEDRRERERTRRRAEDDAAAHGLNALVGRTRGMIEVYKRIGQVSASRVNALIRGETGTGKGMVARAIHYNSADADQPFVAVNCTALPESLLESELFGHVRGAFTGAVGDRRGRFALAGRGTIFLDEVGDTSTEFQAKLLRVLEDREFYPVGADRPERTEARVIAATHRHLEALLEADRFREDLYYRLRVVEIRLPALRERVDDIPVLAHHFIRKASTDLHLPTPTLSDAALQVLLQHDWPGNVRELENWLVRAVVLAAGSVIRPDHLELAGDPRSDADRLATLEEVEAAHVARALAAAGGNKTRAAELLGISKPRLYRLLRRHQLWDDDA